MLVSFSFFLFFICFASSSSFNATHRCSHQQTLDLLLFKESLSSINHEYDEKDDADPSCQDWLGSDYHPMMMKWDKNTDCCKWDGVTCNHFTGDVIGIDLSCGMLKGTILPNTTLFHLPHLQTLNLAFNDLVASQWIPFENYRFSTGLTHLNISWCGFAGEISSEISFLPKLVSLDLSRNSGLQMQPSILKNLLRNSTHLRELMLYDVDIGGVLSSYLNISSSLKSLDLSNTGLQGKLPDNIFNLQYLKKLVLSYNYITGPLPKVNMSMSIPLKWLDLSDCGLVGSLPKSLVNLRHLTTLDLSDNELNGLLPSFLFTLPLLEDIDLGSNMFSGGLPSELFKCRSLKRLSLGSNQFDCEINENFTPPSFIHLVNLTHLDLEWNNFTGVWDLDTLLSTLPSLQSLHLSHSGLSVVSSNSSSHVNPNFQKLGLGSCKLTLFPPSFCNMSNLEHLDISDNRFSGVIPQCLGDISSSLKFLNLTSNHFQGPFPRSICNMRSLETLDISTNSFRGVIPQCLGNISSSLRELQLQSNQFLGAFPPSFCNLRSLEYLDISNNRFSGVIPQCLGNISSLKIFIVGSNQFHGSFPTSICNMRNLGVLDISNNRLSGVIPQCLGNMSSSLWGLIVESNHFQGPFPRSICNMRNLLYLDISNNSFRGVIPQCLGNMSSSLRYLQLQSNQFLGAFPPSICNLRSLVGLDISYNSFSGVIPQCLGNISSSLRMVDMGNNYFRGSIPNVYGDCGGLEGIILSGNQLQGEVPSSLSKCRSLKVLDLGNNQLIGTFPGWSKDLPWLQVLILKSNKLHGPIKTSFGIKSPFPSMQVLDISNNGFEGHLPGMYFQNFKAMKNVEKNSTKPEYLLIGAEYYSFAIVMKGVEQVFPKLFVGYMIIDLSNNKFEGEIPGVIGSLTSLIVLNLSHNHLSGQIPYDLGNISEIESLDVSCNQLTGEIPQGLVEITALEVLNLSENHLVGRIPQGKQFNTFLANSFGGNQELCGFPLPKKCEHPQQPQLEDDGDEDEDEDEDGEWGFTWRVVMMGYGCGTIIGLVMGYVMLSTGRPKWFNAIADAGERIIQTRQNRRIYAFIGK